MGIDVHVVLLLVEAGFLQCEFDTSCLSRSVRSWSCRMVSVASVAVADHLSDDVGTALLGVLEFFKNQDSCTVAHYETSTVAVERKRCVFRVFCTGKCLCIGKACDSERNCRILTASCDDGVSITVADSPECLTDIVRRSGASRNYVDARAFCVMFCRNVACCNVGNHRRDEERGNPLS